MPALRTSSGHGDFVVEPTRRSVLVQYELLAGALQRDATSWRVRRLRPRSRSTCCSNPDGPSGAARAASKRNLAEWRNVEAARAVCPECIFCLASARRSARQLSNRYAERKDVQMLESRADTTGHGATKSDICQSGAPSRRGRGSSVEQLKQDRRLQHPSLRAAAQPRSDDTKRRSAIRRRTAGSRATRGSSVLRVGF